MISKNRGEERVKIKGSQLCCCLVRVKRGSGCGGLTGCLDKYFGGRTYISDGTFLFTAKIRSSRGTVKDGRSSINQDRLFCLSEKSYLGVRPGNFLRSLSLPPFSLSERHSFKCR